MGDGKMPHWCSDIKVSEPPTLDIVAAILAASGAQVRTALPRWPPASILNQVGAWCGNQYRRIALAACEVRLTLCLIVALLSFIGADRIVAAEVRFADPAADVTEVADLMARRLELMRPVAAWKRAKGLAITDAARERKVLDATLRQAWELGIDARSAQHLFELQMQLARQTQERYVEQWRHANRPHVTVQGGDGPLRDLDTELRPQLDAIGTRLLRAIALALPELERRDFSAHYPGLAARVRSPALHSVLAQADADALVAALGKLHRATNGAPLARIKAVGVLRIGITGDYAPFSTDAGGLLAGVDVEGGIELAQALGVQVRFVRTTWGSLLPDLRAGHFDLAMGGISVTSERAAEAAFSRPYHRGGKTPIVRCGTQREFDTLEEIDRPTARVVVNPGGTNERFARERLAQAQVRVHADNRTIFDEILAGRADVMVTDDVEVELQTHRHPGLCRATAATFTSSDKAILMPREDASAGDGLAAAVDGWLAAQMTRGAVARRLEAAFTGQ